MNSPSEAIAIRVAGDINVDWHFYDSGVSVFAKTELGGAAGLTRLLQELIKAKADLRQEQIKKAIKEERPPPPPPLPITAEVGLVEPKVTDIPPTRNAYAVWAPYRQNSKEDAPGVWRAARPMGYGRAGGARETELQLQRTAGAAPRILVLDDGGFDFREQANVALWSLPGAGEAKPGWIVLKTSSPVAQSDLWYKLAQKFAGRLVCIVSANELRREHVDISAGKSWERTLEDLSRALATNPIVKELNACRHLIVTFSVDGALWIDRVRNTSKATLIFDPARAEGEWGEPLKGKAFGYLSCMAAAIAHAATEHVGGRSPRLELGRAIGAGLGAMRDLLDQGHGLAATEPDGYPVKRLAQVLAEEKNEFSIAPIDWPRPAETRGAAWMMISDAPGALDDARASAIAGLSRQIVINGYGALRGVAHAQFGDLVTADRSEIEALRDLRRLMQDYRDAAKADKPLSIGVFGPPGAGKSFGVRQLATEVFGSKAWLEFNLSQFAGPADLVGAFHQVRDKVLGGQTPVVFWDEFDSRAHFWLQYLLAPMQDGRFQDDQLNHAIGKCVLVFAGGTHVSFDAFGPRRGEADGKAKFELAKGPDFRSRLDGYYDVLGPNQRMLPGNPDSPDDPDVPDPTDICHPVRRALLIRAKLDGKSKDRLDIDPDLLSALLEVERYKHGARSLEKLVAPLKSAGRPIRRSSLPPPARRAMHVNLDKFNAILDRNTGYRMSEIIEKLAESIHAEWRTNTKDKKAAHLDVPYAQLAPIDQEDNRAAARRIPDVLALIGLGLVPQADAKSAKRLTDKEIKLYIEARIELLAEAEHDGWMAQRTKNGWRYGTPRDNARKLHPLMVPYGDLPPDEKDKDRGAVRRYPAQAKAAGFKIVWLRRRVTTRISGTVRRMSKLKSAAPLRRR
jgi:RyR domain